MCFLGLFAAVVFCGGFCLFFVGVFFGGVVVFCCVFLFFLLLLGFIYFYVCYLFPLKYLMALSAEFSQNSISNQCRTLTTLNPRGPAGTMTTIIFLISSLFI